MSVEADLLVGIATALDAAGAATYNPSGVYAATDTAIVFGPLQSTPYRQVALTVYGSFDSINENRSEFRVQAYCRGVSGNSLDVGELAQGVFDVLQSLTAQQWGDAYLIQCYRISFVPQGIDTNLCSERADNYAVDVNTPATSRRN